MSSALSLSLILYNISLELCSELGVLVLFVLFASGFVWFMNFRHRRKGIVLWWGLLLSYAMVRSAIIIPMSHFHQARKMRSAKPKLVPTD